MNLRDSLFGGMIERAQPSVGAQHEVAAGTGVVVLSRGYEGDGAEIFAKLVILRVANQADHLEDGIGLVGRFFAAEGTAHRIAAAEDLARELFVDDRDSGGGEIIVLVEIAARYE